MTYADVLHIYGMSRAGYVPQLFSLRLPCPTVVFELLQKANAKALVYDASYASILPENPLPTHLALDINEVDARDDPLPQTPVAKSEQQTVLLMHTSGSTSGSPKLVRCNAKWLDAIVRKSYHVGQPTNPQRQDVCTWMYVNYHPFICLVFDHLNPGGVCVILDKSSCSLAPFNTALAPFSRQKPCSHQMNS